MSKFDYFSVLSSGLEINDYAKTLRVVPKLSEKEYSSIKSIINRLGGKWNSSLQLFTFQKSPKALVDRVLSLGKRAVNQFHLYPTPKHVFELMAATTSLAEIAPGQIYKVLEPSCGFGGMACMIKDHFKSHGATAEITGYEIDPLNVLLARESGIDVSEVDFLKVMPERIYDLIVMNPPFNSREFIKHILHAQKFLKPHGKLISIVPVGEWLYQPKSEIETNLQECICYSQNSILDKNDFFDANTFKDAKVVTTIIEINSVSICQKAIRNASQSNYLLDMALIYLTNLHSLYERAERFKVRTYRAKDDLLKIIQHEFYSKKEVVVPRDILSRCVNEIAENYGIHFSDETPEPVFKSMDDVKPAAEFQACLFNLPIPIEDAIKRKPASVLKAKPSTLLTGPAKSSQLAFTI